MQWVVSTLLVIAVLVGAFALYLRQPPDTSKPTFTRQVMDQAGMSAEQMNRRAIKKFSIDVANGVATIREQMSSIMERNQRFMDYMTAQRDNVKFQGKSLKELMAELSDKKLSSAELTRLKSVSDALENQSRLLVDRGNALVEMNERIRQDMEGMKDRLEQLRATGSNPTDGNELIEHVAELSQKQEDLMAKSRRFSEEAEQLSLGVKQKLAEQSNEAGGNSEAQASIQKVRERQDEILDRIRNNRLDYEAKQDKAKAEAEDNAEKNRREAEKNQEKIQDARDKAAAQREAMRERAALHSRN